MRAILRKDKGFTLIELLIAITIFAVGLISLSMMQITAIRTNSSASAITAAASLAEGVMEEFMMFDASASILRTEVANVAWTGAGWPDKELTGGGIFNATYTVQRDVPTDGVSQITVTVTGTGSRQTPVTLIGFRRYVN